MKRIKSRKTIKVVLAIIFSWCILSNGVIFADGGGGGTNAVGCSGGSRSDNACHANGLSWVYYKITNLDNAPKSGGKLKFMFPTNSSRADYSQGQSTIVGCTGGFWLLGIDIFQANETNRWPGYGSWYKSYQGSTANEVQWRYTGAGKRGQTGGRSWQYIIDNGLTSYMNINNDVPLGFELGYNDKKFAEADHDGSISKVTDEFNSVKNDLEIYDKNGNFLKHGKDATINDVAWFCYDDDKVAQFEGTSTLGSTSLDETNGHYSVTIAHSIKRTKGDTFEAKNKWNTNPTNFPKSNSTWTSNKVGDNNTVKTETITGYLGYNSSVTVCSSLTYYSEMHSRNTNKNKTATSAQACKTFTRGAPTSGGEIELKVYGDYGNYLGDQAKRYVLDENGDGQYEIKYHDHAYRKDGVGDQISFSWKTTNTTKTLTAEGTEDKNMSGGGADSYVGPGGDIVNKYPTVKGVLKYGQTVTFCNNFQWQSHKHKYTSYDYVKTGTKKVDGKTVDVYEWKWQTHTENYTSLRGSKNGGCVQIYRPEKRCAIKSSMRYGIEHGYNYGSVGVKNYNNSKPMSWTAVSEYSSDSALAYSDTNMWAAPGDSIQFRDAACAGAFYTIEANPNISGYGTHYSTAGWIAVNAKGTDASYIGSRIYNNSRNTDGYLFKDKANRYRDYTIYRNPIKPESVDLSAISASTSKPYATWTTGYNGASKPSSGFLSIGSTNPIAEMSGDSSTAIGVPSPKSPSKTGYDGASSADGGKSYKVCKSDGEGCHLGKQDVGTSIVHQLAWNYAGFDNSRLSANEQRTATGIVSVPYNYYLRPYVRNNDNTNVAYLGSTKTMYPGVAVYPRQNKLVHGGATYATITKPTHIEVRTYNARTGREKQKFNIETQRLNKSGDIFSSAGPDESFATGGITFDIIDDGDNKVGDKICMELKIWPIDSHETGSKSAVYGASPNNSNGTEYQYALSEDGTKTAKATSCSVIAKRPTMSVESSNAYSATNVTNKPGFNTSYYSKKFGYDGPEYIFGSWSEYGVFGQVNLSEGKIFTSGAVLGYKTNGYNKPSGSNIVNIPRANNEKTKVASGHTDARECIFMTQTYVNLVGNDCKTSAKTVGFDAMAAYRDNMLERYSQIGVEDKTKKNKVTKTVSGTTKINLNIENSEIENYRAETGNPNSIVALYADGDAVLSKTPKFSTSSNRTIVYNVKGTLTISGSTINDERTEKKGTIGDLTGVIIIANKVWIDPSVTYINAAIVTRDVSGAEVNTCRTVDGTTRAKIGTNETNLGTITSNNCNSTLMFDGPVFTRKIILNRTAGAGDGGGNGQDSIKRAEIFNLNMANYLWSFNQMTHYNQATTTYSRELPTRY